MKEIYLDPNEFQGQIDGFAAGAETIKGLKYDVDEKVLRLKSIDKYQECVAALNETITAFSELLELDAQSMRNIKAAWMNRDDTIATKTLGQIIGDYLKGN